MIFIRQKTKRRGKMEDRHLTEVLTELKRRALLTELALSLAPRREPLSTGDTPPYAVFPCSADLGENALRLFDIADKPEAVQLLAPILIREMHARLLLGEAGTWLWSICAGSQHLQQISHAIAVIKEKFPYQSFCGNARILYRDVIRQFPSPLQGADRILTDPVSENPETL